MIPKPEKLLDTRVVVLAGTESAERLNYLKILTAQWGAQEDDVDTESFTADTKPISEWFALAGVVPFLSERRIVLVRNLSRKDPDEDFESSFGSAASPKPKDAAAWIKPMAESVPESGRVVLIVDDEAGSSDRQEKLKRNADKWLRLLSKFGIQILSFDPVAPAQLPAHLRERAQAMGKKLSLAAASLLSEMVDGRMAAALRELEKLDLYVGEREAITEDDVRQTVIPEGDYSIYRLADSVMAGQSGAALQQLHILFGGVEKIEGEAFQRIFPVLGKQLRMTWQARACIDAGCQPARPLASVLEQWPAKGNLGSEKDWLQRKAMSSARRLDYRRLASCFEILADADSRIKGQGASMGTKETIEEMVLRMASLCR